MVDTVVFDLDNTLYDYDKAHKSAYGAVTDYAAGAFGLSAPQFDALHREANRVLQQRTGGNCAACHNRLIRYQILLEGLGQPISHAPRMAKLYWDTLLRAAEPLPGGAECFRRLKSQGVQVGVGTNMTADYQYAKLDKLGLLDLVDFLVTSEEVGVEKPDPRFFACCAQKAGRAPADCVFVGDDPKNDAQGSLRAGMKALWLCRKGGETPAGAKQINSLSQAPELLSVLAQGGEA